MGKALALDLAQYTMNLALAARNAEALGEVARQVEESGSKALVQPTDVTDEGQCRALIDRTVAVFGGIDFLIVNAGMSMWARFDEITDFSVFRKLMEANYLGAVYGIHAALPYLRSSHGTIVAISSLQAAVGAPYHTGYTASKHALKGFLDSLELEVGDEVHILNVMPGWVRGTNLRARAFTGDGGCVGSTRSHGRHSVGLEECVARIVQAMKTGEREVYIPFKLRFLAWLRIILPGQLKRMIKKAVERE